MPATVIFLTTTGAGSWTVPADCVLATIECIGGGGGGGNADAVKGASGGGGGAYSKKNNLSLTPGNSINYSVGTGGSAATDGNDTWFGNSVYASSNVGAKGGLKGTRDVGGLGGSSGDGIGDVKYSGGKGDPVNYPYAAGVGGGGAAGLNGDGKDGWRDTGTGARYGGAGDNGYGGAETTEHGNPGTEWDATHGSGSGGGGATYTTPFTGGLYGGGGGGGYKGGYTGSSGGIGRQGLIVITYTPALATAGFLYLMV